MPPNMSKTQKQNALMRPTLSQPTPIYSGECAAPAHKYRFSLDSSDTEKRLGMVGSE